MSKKKRTLVKTLTWRFSATLTTVAIVWVFTGRLDIAASVGGVEIVLKMLLYYCHERAWNMVSWGRD